MYCYVVTRIGGIVFVRDVETFRTKNGSTLRGDRKFITLRGALAFARRAAGPLKFPILIEMSAFFAG